MIASTAGCSATSASTSGIVSRGARTACGRAAFEHDERLALRDRPEPVEEHAAVGDALEVRKPDTGLGIVRVVVEIVGHRYRRGIARRHRPTDPYAGETRVVEE